MVDNLHAIGDSVTLFRTRALGFLGKRKDEIKGVVIEKKTVQDEDWIGLPYESQLLTIKTNDKNILKVKSGDNILFQKYVMEKINIMEKTDDNCSRNNCCT